MKKSLFIALEGIDGSGKSTQAKLLKDKLETEGLKVHLTQEPTNHPVGILLRDIFNHKTEADHHAIAALFAADRLEHLLNKKDGIIHLLEQGYTVITDRYYFSSYAYHSVHVPMNWVIELNRISAELLRPDLNIYIDLDPQSAMKRLHSGRSSTELYETKENLINVRNKYLEAFELLKQEEKIYVTDGNRSEVEIAMDIYKAIKGI